MLDKIKQLFASKPRRIDARRDPRGAPGTRVYHEYFVGDAPHEDGWRWMCRVYAQNGAPTEHEGVEDTRDKACRAAIAWAERTKDGLRGVQ